MFEESAMRSVFKAISWRVLATSTTGLLVYLITGSTEFAVAVGLIEGIAKIGLYYVHERLWNRLDVGRRPSGHGAGGAGLYYDLHALPDQAHRIDDFVFRHRQDVADVVRDEMERQRLQRGLQPPL